MVSTILEARTYLVPGAEVLRPAVGDALPELSGHVRRGHQGG